MVSAYGKTLSFAILEKPVLMGGLLCLPLAPGILADSWRENWTYYFWTFLAGCLGA